MPDQMPTAPPQTVAKPKAISPVDALKSDLKKMEGEFKVTLPTHIPPEKFIRAAQTAIQTNPDLANADRRVLFGELMKCAHDGLIPDGREAVITTFKGVPKYNPMVQGICKRARNSGEISTLDAVVVYENDAYEAWIDEKGQHFKHTPARVNRGNPILTYAYAITKDGGFFYDWISEEQMKYIEEASFAKSGPWKGHFKDEMRRKSAIRRLAKYRIPSSSDLDTVIERDEDNFELEPAKADEPTPAKATSSRLAAIVESQVKPPVAPVEAEIVSAGNGAEQPPI